MRRLPVVVISDGAGRWRNEWSIKLVTLTRFEFSWITLDTFAEALESVRRNFGDLPIRLGGPCGRVLIKLGMAMHCVGEAATVATPERVLRRSLSRDEALAEIESARRGVDLLVESQPLRNLGIALQLIARAVRP